MHQAKKEKIQNSSYVAVLFPSMVRRLYQASRSTQATRSDVGVAPMYWPSVMCVVDDRHCTSPSAGTDALTWVLWPKVMSGGGPPCFPTWQHHGLSSRDKLTSCANPSMCCLPLEFFERCLLVSVGRVLQLGLFCLPDWGEVGVCHSFLRCETFL